MTQTVRTYLSLGSNIEPERNLRSALAELRGRFGELVVSPVYRYPAVGFEGPDFLNAAVAFDCDIDPFALSRWLREMETRHGRVRSNVKFCNRTLDIDFVYFDDLILEGPGDLVLPRPELGQAFVLRPLAEIEPHFVDPIRGHTLQQLWNAHPERATEVDTVEL